MNSVSVPAAPNSLYARVIKRHFDIVIASIAIVIALPLMLLVAIAVRILLGSPVMFHDERAGIGGRPIRVPKFRTMSDARDHDGNLLPDGFRLSAFGKLLRRASLDELPQFFSVLVGEMSIVGPRPLPMRYVYRFNARQIIRLAIRPGITGWAQIHGRNAVGWTERLEYDAQYVEALARNSGVIFDCCIIFSTIFQVGWQFLTGHGHSALGTATMMEFDPGPEGLLATAQPRTQCLKKGSTIGDVGQGVEKRS